MPKSLNEAAMEIISPILDDPARYGARITRSAGGATLVDGSTIRVPTIRITDNRGQTMEMNPRPVDVAVTRAVGESYAGKDSQLDAAVAELLKQIGPKR